MWSEEEKVQILANLSSQSQMLADCRLAALGILAAAVLVTIAVYCRLVQASISR